MLLLLYFKYSIYSLPLPQLVSSSCLCCSGLISRADHSCFPAGTFLVLWGLTQAILQKNLRFFGYLIYYLGTLTYIKFSVDYLVHCRTSRNVGFLIFCFSFFSRLTPPPSSLFPRYIYYAFATLIVSYVYDSACLLLSPLCSPDPICKHWASWEQEQCLSSA